MVKVPAGGIPNLPKGAPKEINLNDLGFILKILVKYEDVRDAMFKDPDATLKSLNFIPHAEAIQFFQSLKGADFAAASIAFKPADPDPQLGMGEM